MLPISVISREEFEVQWTWFLRYHPENEHEIKAQFPPLPRPQIPFLTTIQSLDLGRLLKSLTYRPFRGWRSSISDNTLSYLQYVMQFSKMNTHDSVGAWLSFFSTSRLTKNCRLSIPLVLVSYWCPVLTNINNLLLGIVRGKCHHWSFCSVGWTPQPKICGHWTARLYSYFVIYIIFSEYFPIA